MAITLLLDPQRCPACGRAGFVRRDIHRCVACQYPLHWPDDNHAALARDEVRAYWVYFAPNSSGYFRGWCHSSHLLNKPEPHDPGTVFKAPEKGYGTKAPPIKNHSAGTPIG